MVGFVSYQIENDKAFQERIEEAFKKTSDLKIPFFLIAKDFYRSQKAIFKLGSAGKYPPFKGPKIGQTRSGPLALNKPSSKRSPIPESFNNVTHYQYYKMKKFGFDYPLLKATGALERSVTSSNGKGSILNISKASLVIGTTISYANFHQQDNPDLGNKKIPTRKFLFIGPEASNANSDQRGRLDRWLKIIQNHIDSVAKGAK